MISKEEVAHIAKLARLELTEQEIEKMQKDLSAVLDYFVILKNAPEIKIQNPKSKIQHLRKDEAAEKPASLANNLLAAAPDRKEDYIKVKQIL